MLKIWEKYFLYFWRILRRNGQTFTRYVKNPHLTVWFQGSSDWGSWQDQIQIHQQTSGWAVLGTKAYICRSLSTSLSRTYNIISFLPKHFLNPIHVEKSLKVVKLWFSWKIISAVQVLRKHAEIEIKFWELVALKSKISSLRRS